MSIYGPTKTWKIVYNPKVLDGGKMGVAFVEAENKHVAMYTFQQQYAGQYSTIDSCTEFGK
ncbi:MAG: hypothetical protein E7540_04635 [Ruminococcaceae bacterium]|nr:hypothetical protein [Oscillospiraceae bacterium]